ncbi:MAG: arsenate reductase ArsC [Bacteroidales bacterium]|nr:arsenate reductase ArsC [Bacteroidales bacterium]
MNILIICRANSCRSQMAEAFLKKMDPTLNVESVGTEPAPSVHPLTIKVMAEIGFDISGWNTKNVADFIHLDWDFVITVCDIARNACPVFTGNVKESLFFKFTDPLAYEGSDEFLLELIRRTRDHIKDEFEDFYRHFVSCSI